MASPEEEPTIKAGTGIKLAVVRGPAKLRKPGTQGGGAKLGNANGAFHQGDDDDDDEPKPEIIRSLGGEEEPAEEKAPLVIEVREPRWRREPLPEVKSEAAPAEGTANGKSHTLTMEELAAQELVREARGEGGKGGEADGLGTRVIKLSEKMGNGNPDAPMLVKNAVPIPKELVDEKERLKYELSLREDDFDSNSDVYKAVPVAEFGAALLRGMGWKGPSEDDVKVFQAKARPEGLGLGADPGVLELEAQGKKKRRGMKHDSEKTKAALAKAVEEKLKKQVLKADDIVRVKDGKLAGKRAMVIKADAGGIQMVEVELEATGELARVKLTEVFKVPPHELSDDPFKRKDGSTSRGGREKEDRRSPAGESSRQRSRSRSREKKKKKDRKRSRSRSRGRGNEESSKSQKKAADAAPSSTRADPQGNDWLASKIRVRVVTEKAVGGYKQSFYRRTGVVIDVPRANEAIVKMDSGEVLEGMKARHLETALPAIDGIVLILRGRHRHRKAKLLEKDREREQGVVQLKGDRSVHRVSLDDIAEYKGGGEDMDED